MRRWLKVLVIEGHKRVRPTVHGRLQYNLVAWVAQLRPPKEPGVYRLNEFNQAIKENIDFSNRQARRRHMLRPPGHRLVLDE